MCDESNDLYLIVFAILICLLFIIALILLGEMMSLSLMGVKGLNSL